MGGLLSVTGQGPSWRQGSLAVLQEDGASRAGEPLEAVVVLAQSPEGEWGGERTQAQKLGDRQMEELRM